MIHKAHATCGDKHGCDAITRQVLTLSLGGGLPWPRKTFACQTNHGLSNRDGMANAAVKGGFEKASDLMAGRSDGVSACRAGARTAAGAWLPRRCARRTRPRCRRRRAQGRPTGIRAQGSPARSRQAQAPPPRTGAKSRRGRRAERWSG